MFPALHEFLVDDFASIVLASLDMNRLLHDCICAATKGTSGAVLRFTKPSGENRHQRHQIQQDARDRLVSREISTTTYLTGNRRGLLGHGGRDVGLLVLIVVVVRYRR